MWLFGSAILRECRSRADRQLHGRAVVRVRAEAAVSRAGALGGLAQPVANRFDAVEKVALCGHRIAAGRLSRRIGVLLWALSERRCWRVLLVSARLLFRSHAAT